MYSAMRRSAVGNCLMVLANVKDEVDMGTEAIRTSKTTMSSGYLELGREFAGDEDHNVYPVSA